MEIVLELKKFCIQTEARKTYEKLISGYFKVFSQNSNALAMEEQIEGLKLFLKQVDFEYLRSKYPELSGGTDIKVILEITKDQKEIKLKWNGEMIHPKLKNRYDGAN